MTTTNGTIATAQTGAGTRPAGTTVAHLPARYRTVIGWTGHGRVVALTFDDGPGPYTGRVLDILRRFKVHATFCQIGEQVGDYPAIERRIVSEGHVLCNHSWDHDEHLSAGSSAHIDREMRRTQQAITAATGVTPAYFRSPGGDFGPRVKLGAARHHLLPLAWAVDTRDWTRPGVAAITATVLNSVTPGAVILLHDAGGDRSQTVAALPGIIAGLRARGYSFVTLPPDPQR